MNTFNQWLQHNHPEDIKENKALLAALALGTAVPSASQAAPPKPKVMQMGSRLTDSSSPNVQAIGWHLMKKDGINASIKNKTLIGSHEGKPFSIQMENEHERVHMPSIITQSCVLACCCCFFVELFHENVKIKINASKKIYFPLK